MPILPVCDEKGFCRHVESLYRRALLGEQVIDEPGEPIHHPVGQRRRDFIEQLDRLSRTRDDQSHVIVFVATFLDERLLFQMIEMPFERTSGNL